MSKYNAGQVLHKKCGWEIVLAIAYDDTKEVFFACKKCFSQWHTNIPVEIGRELVPLKNIKSKKV